MFKTIPQLKKVLDQYVKKDVQEHGPASEQVVQVQKPLQFIIQKYIEKPFLISGRKFDIRVWVLVNQDFEVFFYREGYVRTSSQEYKLDNCEDQYVHLTNNAVQK